MCESVRKGRTREDMELYRAAFVAHTTQVTEPHQIKPAWEQEERIYLVSCWVLARVGRGKLEGGWKSQEVIQWQDSAGNGSGHWVLGTRERRFRAGECGELLDTSLDHCNDPKRVEENLSGPAAGTGIISEAWKSLSVKHKTMQRVLGIYAMNLRDDMRTWSDLD